MPRWIWRRTDGVVPVRTSWNPAAAPSSAARWNASTAEESTPVLVVPASAVANRQGRQVVFQVEGDRAVEIPVTTGQRLAGLLEIKSGLKDGDKVIGKVDDQIKSGAKVLLKTK